MRNVFEGSEEIQIAGRGGIKNDSNELNLPSSPLTRRKVKFQERHNTWLSADRRTASATTKS